MSSLFKWVWLLAMVGAAPVTQPSTGQSPQAGSTSSPQADSAGSPQTDSAGSPQAEAEIWFKKTYAVQLRASRAADKIALAKLLYEKGIAETSEPFRAVVMLRSSRDIAESLGEVELACRAATGLAGNSGDSLQLRSDALVAVSKNIMGAVKFGALAEECLQTSDDALAAGREALAAKLVGLAEPAARQAHDPLLVTRVHEKQNEVEQRIKDASALHTAQKRLASDASDASANTIAGRHLCFVELNWTAGLPELEKSDDTFFQLAAREDKQGGLGAADAWWEVSEHHTGPARVVARERAVRLYEKNYPAVHGVDRQRAQDRLLQHMNGSGGAIREYQDDPQLLGQIIGPHYASVAKTLEFGKFAIRTDNPHLKHIYATLQIRPGAGSENLERVRARLRLLCLDEQGVPHVLETWRTLKSTAKTEGVIKLTGPDVEAVKAINAGGWSPRDAHLAVFLDSTAIWQSVWQLPEHSCWFLDDSLVSH